MSSPGHVLPVLGELHGEAVEGAPVEARDVALDDQPRLELEARDLVEEPRIQVRAGESVRHAGPRSRRPGIARSSSVDDAVGRPALGLRAEGGDDAVAEDGVGHRLHVLDRRRSRRPWSSARALPARTRYWLARGPAPQATQSFTNVRRLGRRHAASRGRAAARSWTTCSATGTRRTTLLERQDLAARRAPARRSTGLGCVVMLDDLDLLLLGRVVDLHHEHEAVELGLGQRVGALLLDRVLGGEDEERAGRGRASAPPAVTWRSCMASSSAAWVFGGVRLISSARITLAKIGPRRNLNAARAGRPVLLDHLGAGDVRGHQVRRELDAVEGEARGTGPGC